MILIETHTISQHLNEHRSLEDHKQQEQEQQEQEQQEQEQQEQEQQEQEQEQQEQANETMTKSNRKKEQSETNARHLRCRRCPDKDKDRSMSRRRVPDGHPLGEVILRARREAIEDMEYMDETEDEEDEEDEEKDIDIVALREKADADLALGLWPGHASYEVGNLLGRGAFGSVYEGRCRQTGRAVAIKRIDGVFSSKDVVLSSMREMVLHVHVDKTGGRGSVARLVEIIQPDEKDAKFDHIYSVFDKYEQNLHHAMQARKWRLATFEEKRVIAFQIAACVAKLHGCGVAHRDIKPENIVLKNEYYNVVLCDLGMARMSGMSRMASNALMDSRLTDYVTTRWYRAPEVCCRALSDACKYQGDSGMLAADVWSLACVVGEVLRDDNAPIFCGKSSEEQAALIGIALGPLDVEAIYYYDSYARDSEVYEAMIEGGSSLPGESDRCLMSLPSLYKYGVPPLAVDLLRKMLTYDPSKRLTAAEVLRHPFFEGLKVEGGIAETLPSSNASTTTSRRETLSYPFHARRNVKDAIRDCNNNLFSSSSSSR